MTPEERARIVAEMQEMLDDIAGLPQYREYARQGKLSLLDSRFETFDEAIRMGIIKAK